MARTNNLTERITNNPQSNVIKYHDRVFDKFLNDLFPITNSGKKKDKGDDPHLFI